MASPIGSSRVVTSRFGVRGLMSIFRRSSSEQQQGNQETEVKTKPVCKIGHLIDVYGLVTLQVYRTKSDFVSLLPFFSGLATRSSARVNQRDHVKYQWSHFNLSDQRTVSCDLFTLQVQQMPKEKNNTDISDNVTLTLSWLWHWQWQLTLIVNVIGYWH